MYTINLQILLVTLTIKVVTALQKLYCIIMSQTHNRILTDNKNNRLQELKGHSLKRKHPEKITSQNYFNLGNTKTMTKMLLSSL